MSLSLSCLLLSDSVVLVIVAKNERPVWIRVAVRSEPASIAGSMRPYSGTYSTGSR